MSCCVRDKKRKLKYLTLLIFQISSKLSERQASLYSSLDALLHWGAAFEYATVHAMASTPGTTHTAVYSQTSKQDRAIRFRSIDCLLGHEGPAPTLEDGLFSQRLCLLAVELVMPYHLGTRLRSHLL